MPTQRGTATKATAANGTSVSAAKPSGVIAGDLLLAVFTNNKQTVTRPSGWTPLFTLNASTGNSWSTGVYYKVAGSSEPTSYAFSVPSAAPLVLSLSAWSNVDTTTPIGTGHAQVASGALSEPHTGPTASVSAVNGRLIHIRAVRYAGSTVPTFTAPGVTELVDAGVFSGGSVCYANVQYAATADYVGAGSKAGKAITCSQAETDNVEATIALKTKATPASGAFACPLPSLTDVAFEAGTHFDATVSVALPKVSVAADGYGQPVENTGPMACTLAPVSADVSGASAAIGSMDASVLPLVKFQAETRVFGIRVIAVEEDTSRLITVPSRGVDD